MQGDAKVLNAYRTRSAVETASLLAPFIAFCSVVQFGFLLWDWLHAPDVVATTFPIRLGWSAAWLLGSYLLRRCTNWRPIVLINLVLVHTLPAICLSMILAVVPNGFDIGVGGLVMVQVVVLLSNPFSPGLAFLGMAIVFAIANAFMFAIGSAPATIWNASFFMVASTIALPFASMLTRRLSLRNFMLEQEIETERQRYEKLARTDPLTGLANRRHFYDTINAEIARSLRHGTPLSLVIVGVDHFKRINDTYGHDVGDVALRSVAARMVETCRQDDLPARLGGEEFVVVLPHTTLEGAVLFAERLRVACKAPFEAGGHRLSLSVSIGCAELRPGEQGCDAVLQRADLAVYRAKNAGRDRVEASHRPDAMDVESSLPA